MTTSAPGSSSRKAWPWPSVRIPLAQGQSHTYRRGNHRPVDGRPPGRRCALQVRRAAPASFPRRHIDQMALVGQAGLLARATAATALRVASAASDFGSASVATFLHSFACASMKSARSANGHSGRRPARPGRRTAPRGGRHRTRLRSSPARTTSAEGFEVREREVAEPRPTDCQTRRSPGDCTSRSVPSRVTSVTCSRKWALLTTQLAGWIRRRSQ